MRCTSRLADGPIDPTAEFASFQAGLDNEGATVTFTGVARPASTSGRVVQGLFLDHHPRLTDASLKEIAEDVGRRFDTTAITIIHRCGKISPGETIVFVAAAALNRRAAFEAAEFAMDRLKTDAVFWKREDAVDGSHWIEPTVDDRADRARWGK